MRDWRNNVVAAYDAGAEALSGHAEYSPEGRLTTFDVAGNLVCQEEGTGSVCAVPGGLPFAFNGQWRSSLTGLSYMRNRWYSPRLGQFVSHDPLHYVDSTNLYAFAGFDPVNSWDPMGLAASDLAADSFIVEGLKDDWADGEVVSRTKRVHTARDGFSALGDWFGFTQSDDEQPSSTNNITLAQHRPVTANQGQLARLGALIALLFKSTTKGCLKGCGVADRQVAASTTKVLSTVPKLTKGPNNQMLRDAIGHVKALKGDAKQKADLFENLAGQINKLSGGGWSASRSVATDGSHVFLGEAGEVLVIDSAGALFRGSATKGAVVFGSRGTTVNFALLRGI